LGDDFIEHRNISANRGASAVEATPVISSKQIGAKRGGSATSILEQLLTEPSSPDRTEAIAAASAQWAELEPAAAMAWVEKHLHDDARAPALLRVFNRWSDRDPAGALHWAIARSPNAELDLPLWYYSTDTTFRYVDRQKALDASVLITDTDMRKRAIEHVVLIWARKEPAQAAQYVEKLVVLTPGQKAAVQAQIAQVQTRSNSASAVQPAPAESK
jgi:hypothetical protein